MNRIDVVASQQAALLAMYRRHVGPGARYALVDFPDHANVGDSAIWLGETRMLRAVTGRDPDYVATAEGFDAAAFRAASPNGVLFLHGGGNLGDVWPHHQRFREAVLAQVVDRRIVQLPQSIHFRERDGIAAFGALVTRHPDFHLHVRDRPSLALARQHWSCPVDLAPDSAFAIGRQARRRPDCDVLMLMRTDHERIAHDPAPADRSGTVMLDWLDEEPAEPVRPSESRADHYHRRATTRVDRGLAILSRGRQIVTDRLHAHILAVLLDIPHVALDNDYGKISAYIAAWTAASPLLGDAAAG